MKKVLITLDYDPTAQKVAEIGYDLAKTMKAEVILLHVTSNIVYYYSTIENSALTGFTDYMGMDMVQLSTVEVQQKASQTFLDKAKTHLGNKTIKTLVKEGDFAEAILTAAEDVHADIIVMGSHSLRCHGNIVMGSVTEKVMRQTSIPLFVIPTKNVIESYH